MRRSSFFPFLLTCSILEGLFREALPAFTALEEFEWIGYPELRDENVKEMLQSHPNLQSLGLM